MRVKILHTSDWHVGKVLKGRDRHEEHEAVLKSIVQTARNEDVDLVLIAGDLFETSAPTPRAQGLVMRALLALREDNRQVVAIAGNHDNAGLLDNVYRPVLGAARPARPRHAQDPGLGRHAPPDHPRRRGGHRRGYAVPVPALRRPGR